MTGYHRMNIAAKRALTLALVREPHVRCPACEIATPVRDLLTHARERCTGRPEPHELAVWVTWREAVALGMTEATLARAVASGMVRSRGQRKPREMLLRDLVLEVARASLSSKQRCGPADAVSPGGGGSEGTLATIPGVRVRNSRESTTASAKYVWSLVTSDPDGSER